MASQFSQNGTYFAQLTTDSKLKVWETSTNTLIQEYVPDYHLTSPCTCLHFVQAPAPSNITQNGGSSKHKTSLDTKLTYIFLGTSSGLLLVYSVDRSTLDRQLDSPKGEAVTCLSSNDNFLYAGSGCDVVCWNINKSAIVTKWKTGNERITAVLALSTGKRVVSAARGIKVWDAVSKSLLVSLTGHGHDVTVLRQVDNYLVSGSRGDRVLCLWSIDGRSKDGLSVASFAMEDVPKEVSVVKYRDENVLNLAAVTRSGVVHVYEYSLDRIETKLIKALSTVRVAVDSSKDQNVGVIRVVSASIDNRLSLLIGHGTETALTFETLPSIQKLDKVHLLIRIDPHSVLADKLRDQQQQTNKIRTPLCGKEVHYVNSTMQISNQVATKRKINGEDSNITMEKLLESLSIDKSSAEDKFLQLNNVSQLLLQGLLSQDKKLLRSAFIVNNDHVIINTIRSLPLMVFKPFVEELVNMMHDKIKIAQRACHWLRHFLNIHAGLLLSNPQLADLLGPALVIAQGWTKDYNSVIKLNKRMKLCLANIDHRKSNKDEDLDKGVLICDDSKLGNSNSEKSSEESDMDSS